MRQKKVISYSGLLEIFNLILAGDNRTVEEIVKAEEMSLIRDRNYILKFVEDVINNNEATVLKYRKENNSKKKNRAYTSLINYANKDSRVDKVDMSLFTEILNEKLK